MSWNYRIMKYPEGGFGIHEVFYDDGEGTVNGYTVEPVSCTGMDMEDIRGAYKMMADAFDKDTLDWENEDE